MLSICLVDSESALKQLQLSGGLLCFCFCFKNFNSFYSCVCVYSVREYHMRVVACGGLKRALWAETGVTGVYRPSSSDDVNRTWVLCNSSKPS